VRTAVVDQFKYVMKKKVGILSQTTSYETDYLRIPD